LKGKAIVNEVVSLHSIDPELLKIDVAPLALKLRNNRISHIDYLRHTQEETATLREIVESSSGLRLFFRYAMFNYSFYLCYSLSLYPFTERYAQPYFFSCLIQQEIDLGDRPRRQETTLGGADAQTRFKTASKKSRDPSLSEVNTSGSGEDRMEHPDDLTDFVPPTPHDSPLLGGHRLRSDKEVIVEDKGSGEKGGSTVDQVSTARPEVSVASVLANVKGVAFRDVEEPPRLPRSTTTLQPLPTIDPKEKGKYTHQQLKHKTLEELKKLYQKEQKWINDFVPLDSKKEEKKSIEPKSKGKKGKRIKRVADLALKHKSSKKQKMIQESTNSDKEESTDYEHEKEELRMWLIVVLDKEETMDPEILSTKANENISYHKSLSSMLRKFDRQDLVDLHRLVMKRFKDNTPEGYNLLLWGDLKKLYENCRVHTLLMNITLNYFNMLVEKRYPLIKEMLEKMLNWKLEGEAESTMAFELLKFIKSQVED
nr:hypothetical protein [Tanacetum cinerariifolium]